MLAKKHVVFELTPGLKLKPAIHNPVFAISSLRSPAAVRDADALDQTTGVRAKSRLLWGKYDTLANEF